MHLLPLANHLDQRMESLLSRTYWNAVLRLARSLDVDLDDLIAQLRDPQFSEYIPFAVLSTAVQRIVPVLPDRSIGFAVGRQLAVSSHGSLGMALSSCRDLAECLDIVTRYEQTRAQFFDLNIRQLDAQRLSLQIGRRHAWEPIALPLYETLLMCIYEILQYMIGSATLQCTVKLPYSAPVWACEYTALELADIEFDAEEFSFTLSAELLSMPSISFDAKSLEHARQQCERELQQLKSHTPLAQTIREYLDEGARYTTTIDEMARYLCCSTSTLIRRLKLENTSYKTLVEELRKQQALAMLGDGARSIESIAYQLGYSDVSNFSRSFKRWYGCTPGAYRKSMP